MKNLLKNKKFIYAVVSLLVILLLGFILSNVYLNKVKVKKILNNKYDKIICIDSDCNGIEAEEKLDKKTNVKILDSKGALVGNYSYKNSTKNVKEPYKLTKNYMLMKKKISKNNTEYSINTKNAKERYKTKNDLTSINEYIVLETKEADIDYLYNIINQEGKKVLKDVTEYESYFDGNISSCSKDEHNYILDKKGKVLHDGYTVQDVYDKYLILTIPGKNLYYYFNADTEKLITDGFNSYKINKDNSLEIVRKENNNDVVYNIDENGKESKVKSGSLYETIKKIKKDIDTDTYDVYTSSIVDKNTTKVFVDNKNDRSFGIYDINNKSYDKFYDYSSSAANSDFSILKSEDDSTYFQISCSKPMCLESHMYVYSYDKSSILFNLDGNDKLATEYNQYSNGYKVVKYSRNSSDSEYKNKYVLYNSKNKEVEVSDNQINVAGSKLLIGQIYEKALLYVSKDKKIVNDKDNLAYNIEGKYFQYANKFLDKDGNELYSAKSDTKLQYSNGYVYSVNDKNVKVYCISNNKLYTYKLSKNESIYGLNKENMIPYKSIIMVNNETKKYSKLINVKSNKVRKLKKINIFSVDKNEDDSANYLITINKENKNIKYGLYILN